MPRDQQLTFSKDQAVTATGTALSENVLDVEKYFSGRGGADVRFILKLSQAFTSGGAGTLQVQLVEADNAALTTNAVVLHDTGALALAALTADNVKPRIDIPLPKNSGKKYLGLKYIVGTAAMTAGRVTSYLDIDSATPVDEALGFYTGR